MRGSQLIVVFESWFASLDHVELSDHAEFLRTTPSYGPPQSVTPFQLFRDPAELYAVAKEEWRQPNI